MDDRGVRRRRWLRLLAWHLAVTLLAVALSVGGWAAWEEKDGARYYSEEGGYATGWREIGGERYYFAQDGAAVTKSRTIDGLRYRFDQNGVCKGLFTGWTRSGGNRYRYQDGQKQTGWLELSGKRYYLNRDGIMRTGWVPIWGETSRLYFFEEDGVWDGKDPQFTQNYKPRTLGDFLLDYPAYDALSCSARRGNRKFQDFAAFEQVLEILARDKDAVLLYDTVQNDCEIELNPGIHRGSDDIFIRLLGEDRHLAAPGIHFSKDAKGNSYFYCSYYNLGVKLSDPGVYDRIAKLLGEQ